MFDKAILETRAFLHISLSAKALYFLLGMEADDEGFVDPERVMRIYGGELGDIKNLIDVGLIIPFKSGVVVITHWKQNNWLDSRRIKPTQCQEEKNLLFVTKQKKYELYDKKHSGLADAKQMLSEYRIEENRGEENSIETIAETSSATGEKKDEKPLLSEQPQPVAVIPDLLVDGKIHVQIIGLYQRAKNIVFSSREQQQVFVRRNVRPARLLASYGLTRIADTMAWLRDNADFKWTLETVGKYIDEDLSKLTQKGGIKVLSL